MAGKHTMPIIPFLEGRVFWPETTRAMGEVFEKARAMLGLADKTDSATALLAMEMTALAAMGIHDDVLLCRSRPGADHACRTASSVRLWSPRNQKVARRQMGLMLGRDGGLALVCSADCRRNVYEHLV